MEHAILRDARIVDENVNRAEVLRDLCQSGGSRVEIADVPFVDIHAGLGLELRGGLVVAVINGGDLVARRGERLRYRSADPARAAGYDRNPVHCSAPFCFFSEGARSFRTALHSLRLPSNPNAPQRSIVSAIPMPPPMQ